MLKRTKMSWKRTNCLLQSLICNYCILFACFDIVIDSRTRVHVLLEYWPRLVFESGDYFVRASGGAATTWERRLIESGVWSRAASDRERRLIESGVWSSEYGIHGTMINCTRSRCNMAICHSHTITRYMLLLHCLLNNFSGACTLVSSCLIKGEKLI